MRHAPKLFEARIVGKHFVAVILQLVAAPPLVPHVVDYNSCCGLIAVELARMA